MAQLTEITATGLRALELTTALLQRARLQDPLAGNWEAADPQWWWAVPRESDDVAKVFWLDDSDPVAAVLLTSWRAGTWWADPVLVPGQSPDFAATVWQRALELGRQQSPTGFSIPVSSSDPHIQSMASAAGLVTVSEDYTTWMSAAEWQGAPAIPEGFRIADRSARPTGAHPIAARNGPQAEGRLRQCSLYDPKLDLAVLASNGEVAGYSLYWLDPVTGVGLVEPVRIEADYHRRGLARAMVGEGVRRLFASGAKRVKVSYESEAAGALYLGLGFRPVSTTAWYGPPG